MGIFARELTQNRFRWFTCTGEWKTGYHHGVAGGTEKREINFKGSSRELPLKFMYDLTTDNLEKLLSRLMRILELLQALCIYPLILGKESQHL